MTPNFVLSHPDITAGFVRETGVALRDAGWRCEAVTHLVDRPEALWRRAICRAGRLLGLDLDREFRRRALVDPPWSSIATFPLWELLRVATLRLGWDRRVSDMVFERATTSLDRRTARALRPDVTHVYGYEFSACETFEAAARRGIGRIYEIPSPEYSFVERLLAAETATIPELRTGADPYFEGKRAERLARRKREWELADLVIVNSQFTLNSFVQAGYDTAKVRVVGLGAPPVAAGGPPPAAGNSRLKCLWAGTFSIRKGAHYLLDAWKRVGEGRGLELDVYGAWALPDRFRANLSPSIRFHGSVPQAELFQRYRAADLLVFPTLCDGFGMVIPEAFANGVPVITTDRASAAERWAPARRPYRAGRRCGGLGGCARMGLSRRPNGACEPALETARRRRGRPTPQLAGVVAHSTCRYGKLMPSRICIVTPGHLASNPRVVKEADALRETDTR